MPVRCGDCVHLTMNLSQTKYLCRNKFSFPEVRPRKPWKCPFNAFSPVIKSQNKYRKFGRYWSFNVKLKTGKKRHYRCAIALKHRFIHCPIFKLNKKAGSNCLKNGIFGDKCSSLIIFYQ